MPKEKRGRNPGLSNPMRLILAWSQRRIRALDFFELDVMNSGARGDGKLIEKSLANVGRWHGTGRAHHMSD
jgi:hypothetical protein